MTLLSKSGWVDEGLDVMRADSLTGLLRQAKMAQRHAKAALVVLRVADEGVEEDPVQGRDDSGGGFGAHVRGGDGGEALPTLKESRPQLRVTGGEQEQLIAGQGQSPVGTQPPLQHRDHIALLGHGFLPIGEVSEHGGDEAAPIAEMVPDRAVRQTRLLLHGT